MILILCVGRIHFWYLSGLLALVTFKRSLLQFLFPRSCFSSPLFNHSQHSDVGLSLFGLHVKEHDAGARVSPANTNRAQYFFVLPPPIFVFAQTKSFFSPTKAWTQRNMLMLCPPKGFMHLFSSLLFKAFSLPLMFSLYHDAMWLHLTTGQSVYACVFGATFKKINNIYIFFLPKHFLHIYWAWHTVSTFAFCLCTLAAAPVE